MKKKYLYSIVVMTMALLPGCNKLSGDNNSFLALIGLGGQSTTATRVYGQGGSFTTSTINNGGVSADSLYHPIGVAAYDGGVYIADDANNRVLWY
ncbi:MAG: hypothetical protein A2176_06985 [Spirochaetes bacterium RBG_13_51_14]|nr:MAG: hypothetical protein A2176_06985 [Spirochaetes bacterium RBG_13_51_14]